MKLFSRTALAVIGLAMVAGGAYGVWQYRTAPLQTANLADTVLSDAGDLLPGAWTSMDDAAYRITFSLDGTVTEEYGDSEVSRGTYTFADSPAGYVSEGSAFETGSAHAYLLEEIDGERFAYRVLAITADSLELSYLERGNTLTFSR